MSFMRQYFQNIFSKTVDRYNKSLKCVTEAYLNIFVKNVGIWSFSGPYFLAFGLNTDQKNYEYGHFSRSV